MKQTIEKPRNSLPTQEDLARMAAVIRDKKQRGLTLSGREERFLREQQEENRRDDNPQYGH